MFNCSLRNITRRNILFSNKSNIHQNTNLCSFQFALNKLQRNTVTRIFPYRQTIVSKLITQHTWINLHPDYITNWKNNNVRMMKKIKPEINYYVGKDKRIKRTEVFWHWMELFLFVQINYLVYSHTNWLTMYMQ